MVLHSRTLIKLRDSCGRTVFVAPTLKSVGETILGHKVLTSFCSLKLKLAIQGLGKVKLLCGRSSRRELSKASLAGFGRDGCRIKLLHGTVLATLNSSPLSKREGNWNELSFAKTSGTVTGDREKIGQSLSGACLVTIPERIAERISAPISFSLLKESEKKNQEERKFELLNAKKNWGTRLNKKLPYLFD